jgi:hypothetical protein
MTVGALLARSARPAHAQRFNTRPLPPSLLLPLPMSLLYTHGPTQQFNTIQLKTTHELMGRLEAKVGGAAGVMVGDLWEGGDVSD